jgi:protein involved in polysaccharide export with SLBB domain
MALQGEPAMLEQAPPVQAMALQASPGAYVIRSNDELHVRVYNEQEMTGDYKVDGGGFISIPLLGPIHAAGLTMAQLERAITKRLAAGLFRDPKVSVQMANYAPFYIHGEVKRPGEFPYRPGLTIADAVASAGGYTYRADESKTFVTRAGTATESTYRTAPGIPVYPGDNIRVPERFF